MSKKRGGGHLVIASASDIKTTVLTSIGGRSQIKQSITGNRGGTQGHDVTQPVAPFSQNRQTGIEEEKETLKSKSAGIKMESRTRNINSVSYSFVLSKFNLNLFH
jgi:hypothetical protein